VTTWSSTDEHPVESAATVTIVSAARAAFLRTPQMISGRPRPVTQRHAPATIERPEEGTRAVFPEAADPRTRSPNSGRVSGPRLSGSSVRSQLGHGNRGHSGHMTVVTQLLAAVGTLTAVVLILLMAAVPLLLDLPLRSAPHSRAPRGKGR
jgi:hypothetical protein